MSARHANSSKLRFEGLERRLLMAGNVTATFQAGNLFITGDNLANGVSIVGSTVAGELVVKGLPAAGIATTVNNKNSVTFEHVKNVTVDLKSGDDIVRIGNAAADQTRISGDLTIERGVGNKTVNVNNAAIDGIVSLATGQGSDVVVIDNLTAKKPVAIDTGMGNDAVTVRNSISADLTVSLGGGDDSLTFKNNAVRKACTVNGGAGRDTLNANWQKVNSGSISAILFEKYV